MAKKVYCRDCKWYVYKDYCNGWGGGTFEACKHPENILENDHYDGVVRIQKHRPKERNEDNDCIQFQLKWWKWLFCPSKRRPNV